ncbi:hypothetical protein [Sphaerotilus sp.]|uniref:hypothetical protein n=1 Tax=Sphaerotilus sp. TaxID=2093942 RepID=UPI00286DBC83|nr:hypothetical protein [Sphaerotilus sp.]
MTARNWNRVLPIRLPMVDRTTGMVTREWVQFLLSDGHKIGRDFDTADGTIASMSVVVDAQSVRIAALEARAFSQAARISELLDAVDLLRADVEALQCAPVAYLTQP